MWLSLGGNVYYTQYGNLPDSYCQQLGNGHQYDMLLDIGHIYTIDLKYNKTINRSRNAPKEILQLHIKQLEQNLPLALFLFLGFSAAHVAQV